MKPSEILTRPLDDDELETILAIAKNEQTGRITPFEVRALVAAYRVNADLYEALKAAMERIETLRDPSVNGPWNDALKRKIDAALAKATGEAQK